MATTFVTTPASPPDSHGPRSQATCTTGNEAGTHVLGDTDGLPIDGIEVVAVWAKSGAAFTAGGKLAAYIRNPVDGAWAPVSDGSLDLILAAVTAQTWAGLAIQPGLPRGTRLALLPSGAGGANPITVDLVGGILRGA